MITDILKSNVRKDENTEYKFGLDTSERVFAFLLVFSFLNGIIAHLLPSVYPFTLYITDALLLLLNGVLFYFIWRKHRDTRLLVWAFIAYLGTFFIEVAGVATGKIFGNYTYGDTMFVQVLEVPLVIAFNWVILILASNEVAGRFFRHPIAVSAGVGVFIAFYDYWIEPVAMKLDYWQWANDIIPAQNFIAWAIIAFLFSLPLQYLRIKFSTNLLLVYLLAQFAFFAGLNLFF